MKKNTNKSQLLIKLFKESVRQVIREEMQGLRKELLEEIKNNRSLINENPLAGKPVPNRVDFRKFMQTPTSTVPQRKPDFQMQPNVVSNPLAALIADAGQNITNEEYNQMMMGNEMQTFNMNSSMVNPATNLQDVTGIGEIEEWTPQNMKLPNFG